MTGEEKVELAGCLRGNFTSTTQEDVTNVFNDCARFPLEVVKLAIREANREQGANHWRINRQVLLRVLRQNAEVQPPVRHKRNVSFFREDLARRGRCSSNKEIASDFDVICMWFTECRDGLLGVLPEEQLRRFSESSGIPVEELLGHGRQAMLAVMRSALRCSLQEIGLSPLEARNTADEFMGIEAGKSFLEILKTPAMGEKLNADDEIRKLQVIGDV